MLLARAQGFASRSELMNNSSGTVVPRREPNLGESMKTKFTALALIAALAFALMPKRAEAGDQGLAIAGGFIGGLIVASALNDAHHDYYDAPTAPVVVVNDRGPWVRHDGYWRIATVRVWVPGYWLVERGHHGRCFRRYVEGHMEYRRERVWVGNGDCRPDASYGYGR